MVDMQSTVSNQSKERTRIQELSEEEGGLLSSKCMFRLHVDYNIR